MALNDDIRRLAGFDCFRALEDDALRLLAFSAETRLLRAGDALFRQGEAADAAYLLVTGAIDLADGAGEPRHLTPVVLIGETALITETERPATATATSPTTVLRITRALFHRILDEYPRSARKLQDVLAERVRATAAELGRFADG